VLSLAVLLSGCPVAEDNFPTRYADAYCQKWRSCDRGEFEAVWEKSSECTNEVEALIDTLLGVSSALGGEYDPQNGGRCVSKLRSASCDEVSDWDFSGSCDDVME